MIYVLFCTGYDTRQSVRCRKSALPQHLPMSVVSIAQTLLLDEFLSYFTTSLVVRSLPHKNLYVYNNLFLQTSLFRAAQTSEPIFLD